MSSDERFHVAVEFVLRHEGGYADDPADRGGKTNWGLSSVHHPDLDVRDLTRARAIEEYRRRYWERYRLDEIDDVAVATKVLDLCVWMGPDDAARYLQTAICAVAGGPVIVVDGVIGWRMSMCGASVSETRRRSDFAGAGRGGRWREHDAPPHRAIAGIRVSRSLRLQ